jgi:predicted TIM-barrel fold metal-dependent hydrolase
MLRHPLSLLFAVTVCVCLGGGAGCRKSKKTGAAKTGPYRGVRVDAHAHISALALVRLLKIMEAHGIEHIINFSGGIPARGLPENLDAAVRSGGRISVMCNIPWRAFPHVKDFVPRVVKLLQRCKTMGAVGLKIEKGLGLFYRDETGALLRVDDSRLSPIFEAAGRLKLPVAIHTADPKAFWLPNDKRNERYEELTVHPGWSFHGREVPSWEVLWNQFAAVVRRHKKTIFVGVHFGNAAEEPARVARLLTQCPNLYIDTAARIPEFGRHPPKKMRRFFMKFQDRILFGTDMGAGRDHLMLGSSGAEEPGPADIRRFFGASWRYFESRDRDFDHPTPIQGKWKISGIGLPHRVLKKIYRDNAVKVYGLKVR